MYHRGMRLVINSLYDCSAKSRLGLPDLNRLKMYYSDVMSHIGWGGEQITLYKGVETFP